MPAGCVTQAVPGSPEEHDSSITSVVPVGLTWAARSPPVYCNGCRTMPPTAVYRPEEVFKLPARSPGAARCGAVLPALSATASALAKPFWRYSRSHDCKGIPGGVLPESVPVDDGASVTLVCGGPVTT